jgi:hypothetical protein
VGCGAQGSQRALKSVLARLDAGEAGAQVLLMQIPAKADVYHTPAAREALAAIAQAT